MIKKLCDKMLTNTIVPDWTTMSKHQKPIPLCLRIFVLVLMLKAGFFMLLTLFYCVNLIIKRGGTQVLELIINLRVV